MFNNLCFSFFLFEPTRNSVKYEADVLKLFCRVIYFLELKKQVKSLYPCLVMVDQKSALSTFLPFAEIFNAAKRSSLFCQISFKKIMTFVLVSLTPTL